MNDTPQTIKHTLRLPLGVLVDDEWKEIGVVEVPVNVRVNTVHGLDRSAEKWAREIAESMPSWPLRSRTPR